MANQAHLETLAKGVETWNAWRVRQPGAIPDLSQSQLDRMDLRRAELRRADLRGSSLSGANLEGAGLLSADLAGAVLIGANLRHADLSGAYFRSTSMAGTCFEGARLRGTTFANVDFQGAIALDLVRHDGPSSIGIDTIQRSQAKIPEAFLRGAGVPENFITYMKSLTVAAFDFYSCFISYSTKDQDFADRLYADLQARRVRCWFAPHDVQGGRKLHEQIDEAIRRYDKLLLILSDSSMNSPWVKTEIANARARETEHKRQMLFPLSLVPFGRIKTWKLFDADTGIDSAREIREYYVPDFSQWKDHDSYAAAFERLVRDLKAIPNTSAVERTT